MRARLPMVLSALVAVAILVVGLGRYLDDDEPGEAREPFQESRLVEGAIVRVVATPGSVGPTDVHLYVEDPEAGLDNPETAAATLELGAERIELELIDSGRAHWLAEEVPISTAGTWSLRVVVESADGRTLATTFSIPIGDD